VGVWAWRPVAATLAVALAVALAAGCSVSSHDVVEEARARGGGLSGELVAVAVGAVAEDQDVDTPALRSVTVVFTRVILEVAMPADGGLAGAEEVVAYELGTSGRFGGRGLDGPEEVELPVTGEPLGPSLFTLDQAGVDRFDAMVTTALREADLDGGYAAVATIARPAGGGDPETVVTVTDGRREVDVTFGPDGAVREVAG
ncbi:MAG TPA: hypothetical protein VIL36_15290, partial [Acidimicrobiales bacterium]